MYELKPCPFCGDEATLKIINGTTAYVRCNSCFAQSRAYEANVDYCATQVVAELWNRRSYTLEEYEEILYKPAKFR